MDRASTTPSVSSGFSTPVSPDNNRSKVAESLVRNSFSTRRSDAVRRATDVVGSIRASRRVPAATHSKYYGSLRYRTDEDNNPCKLLAHQPIQVAGTLLIKRTAAPALAVSKLWERVRAELRGCMIVIKDEVDELQRQRSREKCESAVGGVTDSSTEIQAIVNILGCTVFAKRGDILRLKKPKSNVSVSFKFQNATECARWEHVLEESASQRFVTLADFKVITQLSDQDNGESLLVRDRFSGDILEMRSISKQALYTQTTNLNCAISERLAYELAEGQSHTRQLRYAFQSRDYAYLILEAGSLPTLEGLLKRVRLLEERVVRRIIAELLVALQFLHSKGIIHGELQPSSLLVDSSGHVLLTGFTHCRIESDITDGLCGLNCSVRAPPETVSGGSETTASDFYRLGILIFILLQGREPLNPHQLQEDLQREGSVAISEEVTSLMRGLFVKVPEKRLGGGLKGVREVMEHEFFRGVNWNGIARKESHRDIVKDIIGLSSEHRSIERSSAYSNSLDSAVDDDPQGKTAEVFSDVSLWPITRGSRHVIEDRVLVGWFYSRGRASKTVR